MGGWLFYELTSGEALNSCICVFDCLFDLVK